MLKIFFDSGRHIWVENYEFHCKQKTKRLSIGEWITFIVVVIIFICFFPLGKSFQFNLIYFSTGGGGGGSGGFYGSGGGGGGGNNYGGGY